MQAVWAIIQKRHIEGSRRDSAPVHRVFIWGFSVPLTSEEAVVDFCTNGARLVLPFSSSSAARLKPESARQPLAMVDLREVTYPAITPRRHSYSDAARKGGAERGHCLYAAGTATVAATRFVRRPSLHATFPGVPRRRGSSAAPASARASSSARTAVSTNYRAHRGRRGDRWRSTAGHKFNGGGGADPESDLAVLRSMPDCVAAGTNGKEAALPSVTFGQMGERARRRRRCWRSATRSASARA